MTSDRIVGRPELSVTFDTTMYLSDNVNFFSQPTSYLICCRHQCCRLEMFRDDDDATIGRRSCDQLQCTVCDDHVEFDAVCFLWHRFGERATWQTEVSVTYCHITVNIDKYYLIPPQVFIFFIRCQCVTLTFRFLAG